MATDVAVFGASPRFAELASQRSWFSRNSESCRGSGQQQPAEQWLFPAQAWLWELLWSFVSVPLLSWLSQLLYKIHFSSHVTARLRNSSLLLCRLREGIKTVVFWSCSQLMRHSLFELFHLSNLLQVPSGRRTVDVGLLGNFLCTCKRISFKDGSRSAGPCRLPMAGHYAPQRQGSCQGSCEP